jgi:hypothetical protein
VKSPPSPPWGRGWRATAAFTRRGETGAPSFACRGGEGVKTVKPCESARSAISMPARRETRSLLSAAKLSDKHPLTPAPRPQRGEGRGKWSLCPRPLGGEGGSQPPLSSAGASRVRGFIRHCIMQRSVGGCGKTPQYCHPEQQRRISPRVLARQCEILRRLLAPQNDSTFEFFRSLLGRTAARIERARELRHTPTESAESALFVEKVLSIVSSLPEALD